MSTDTASPDQPASRRPHPAAPHFMPQAAFRHLGVSLARDMERGGQLATHRVEVLAPQPGYNRFVAQYRDRSLPENAGLRSWIAAIDSTGWRAGQTVAIRQRIRLPAATYQLAVGVFDARRKPRPRFETASRQLVTVEPVTVEAEPQDVLQRPRPLLPVDMDRLLDEVLAMPALGGDNRDQLTFCMGQAPQFGHVMEFGVASGRTVNQLAALVPHRTVWGFDSFEGLPERWVLSEGTVYDAGTFGQAGLPPFVRGNVRLVQGLIEQTLPDWLAQHVGPAALVHVDVDLYSVTRAILDLLNDRIVPSTVLVFDDVAIWSALKAGKGGSYEHWRDGEWRALHEWAAEHGRRFALVSRLERMALALRVLV